VCVYVSRGKDSGAYDLGELDQAFFLYLDGQADPSTVQDQRRELSRKLFLTRTHTWKFLSLFFFLASNLLQFKRGTFPSHFSFVCEILFVGSHQKHVWLIPICSSFVLPLTKSLQRREGQKME